MERKKANQMVRSRLNTIERKLSRAGVATVYRRATVTRPAFLVFFEGDGITFPFSTVDGGFNITFYATSDNGVEVLVGSIYTVLNGERRTFGWHEVDGTFAEGLRFVIQNYSTTKPTTAAAGEPVTKWNRPN